MTLWEYYFGMLLGLLLESLNAATGFNAVTVWFFFSICITHLLFMEVISVQRAFIDDFLTHRPSINLSRTHLELMFLHLCSGD